LPRSRCEIVQTASSCPQDTAVNATKVLLELYEGGSLGQHAAYFTLPSFPLGPVLTPSQAFVTAHIIYLRALRDRCIWRRICKLPVNFSHLRYITRVSQQVEKTLGRSYLPRVAYFEQAGTEHCAQSTAKGSLSNRQRKPERCAMTGFAIGSNLPAVRHHNLLCNRQPQARTAARARA
jgi:hypothetical protein